MCIRDSTNTVIHNLSAFYFPTKTRRYRFCLMQHPFINDNFTCCLLYTSYGFDSSLIADIKPTFAEQGHVNAVAAKELGLKEGTPITYLSLIHI